MNAVKSSVERSLYNGDEVIQRSDHLRDEEGRPDWLAEEDFPFQSRYLDVLGNRIHFVDEGSGPVLFFVHGVPAWSFLYRKMIRDLRHRFRCVALDLPGFGLSSARAGYSFGVEEASQVVERFLLTLDLHDVTLVVHDLGGPIGLGVAGRHPERFRGFVLTNTFGWTLDSYPSIRRFLGFAGSPLFNALNVNFNLLLYLFTRSLGLSESEKMAYLGPTQERRVRQAMSRILRSISKADDYLSQLESNLTRVTHLPALILWGRGDSGYKAGFHERFARLFSDHQLEIVLEGNERTGHFPQEGGSARMVKAIDSWWR